MKATLRQIVEKHGDFCENSPSNTHMLVFSKAGRASPDYWDLADYVVAALCGPYIALAPRLP